MEKVPSGDAIGNWMRNRSEEKIESTQIINKNLSKKALKKEGEKELTLDIDGMEVEGEKEEAKWTYKGNKGYMPMLGFIPEMDWCIGYEFREGNRAPREGNYEFLKEIIEFVEEATKKEKEIKRVRIDAAGYQAKVINYIKRKGSKYTITVGKDVSVKKAIKRIPDEEWKVLRHKDGIRTGREYAEFIHSMNGSDHAFRIIVQRWLNPQGDLFDDIEEYCYHGIATNYREEEKSSEEVIWWHNGRSNSENYNKELKQGFNLDYVPCGKFKANAVWFGLGILAYQ